MSTFVIIRRVFFHLILLASVSTISTHVLAYIEPTWVSEITPPTQDTNGWTKISPSSDSRLLYVSADGDDSTAEIYYTNSNGIGSDPRAPEGVIRPFASIQAALGQARAGYPDWILIKKGDSFYQGFALEKGGRSPSERLVITSYGNTQNRPVLLKNDPKSWGLTLMSNASNVAIVGLELYQNMRDPDSPDFAGFEALDSTTRGITFMNGSFEHVLIEDCKISFFDENLSLVSSTMNSNIIIRRNIIANAFSNHHRSQGMWANSAHNMLLEQNIFYHNGWYQQNIDANQSDTSLGKATLFNHHTYFSSAKQVIFRENVFLSSSSISNKFTSNASNGVDTIKSQDIVLQNNFYYGGEVAISLGGNTDNNNGFRWANLYVVNNVLTGIGMEAPTGRTLGWGIGMSDTDNGVIEGNILTNYGSESISNTQGIELSGHLRNVTVENNTIYGLYGQGALRTSGVVDLGNNKVIHNKVQNIKNSPISWTSSQFLVDANTFWASYSPNTWWDSTSSSWNNNGDGSIAFWINTYGDTNAKAERIDYYLADRDFTSFKGQLGFGNLAYKDFIEQYFLTLQKSNWDIRFGAEYINNYFREGLCPSDNTSCFIKNKPTPPRLF